MIRNFYHGTSADNLQSILQNGLSTSDNKIWTCSEDGVYLWDTIALAKANGRDLEDDADYIEDEAFRMANESGQIACACANDCRIVVIKVSIDDSEVNEDTSCPNMEGSGAVVLYRDILPHEIVEIKVSNDVSLVKGYFISLIYGRDYNNIDFNCMEQRIAKAFQQAELYPDDIDGIIEWENVPLQLTQLKTA